MRNQSATAQNDLFLKITFKSSMVFLFVKTGLSAFPVPLTVFFFAETTSFVNQIQRVTRPDTTPTAAIEILQPKRCDKSARGVVAINHPAPPTAISNPETRASSMGRNSSARMHMVAIKIAERPNPIIPLERMAILKSGAKPKQTAPKEAIVLKSMMV